MTQLMCPLCGRFVSLRYFDPSRFAPDVLVVEVVGLGRGKGVRVDDRYSILRPNNPTVALIKARLLELSKALLDHDCLSPEELLSTLDLDALSPEEECTLRERIESLLTANENLELQVKTERVRYIGEHRRFQTLVLEVEALKTTLEEVMQDRDYWKSEMEALKALVEEDEAQENDDYDINNNAVAGDGFWKYDAAEQITQCKSEWIQDPKIGYKIRINEWNPTCQRTFGHASQRLGPYGKKYLRRHIETTNPEARQALRTMGLLPKS